MGSSHTSDPLKAARLASLFLASAWAVVAGSVGLNALIKSNQSQSKLKASVPSPTTVDINVSDVFISGLIATIICAIIAAFTFALLVLQFTPSTRQFAQRTLRTQAYTLFAGAACLLGSMIPFTHFVRTRSAQVHAFIGGVEIPQSLVQAVEQKMGATGVYHELGYLRLDAIIPWIALLFTLVAASILLVASSRVDAAPSSSLESSFRDKAGSAEGSV